MTISGCTAHPAPSRMGEPCPRNASATRTLVRPAMNILTSNNYNIHHTCTGWWVGEDLPQTSFPTLHIRTMFHLITKKTTAGYLKSMNEIHSEHTSTSSNRCQSALPSRSPIARSQWDSAALALPGLMCYDPYAAVLLHGHQRRRAVAQSLTVYFSVGSSRWVVRGYCQYPLTTVWTRCANFVPHNQCIK